MNLFDLPSRQWWKYMENVLENVALQKISFVGHNNKFTFELANTIDGKFYKELVCDNVWTIKYGASFDSGEEFPDFICDIKTRVLSVIEIESAFKHYKFGFPNIPSADEYCLVCLVSGELCIEVLCESIKIL